MQPSSIPKLASTINQNFNLNNFIDLSEAEEYLKEQPIIKDIIIAYDEIKNALGAIYDKVMKLVNEFMSVFDGFKQLFDSFGLKDLFKSIFDFTAENTTGFGFSGEVRSSLQNMYVTSCDHFNSNLKNHFGVSLDLQGFTIFGFLHALVCTGEEGAVTGIYNLLEEKTDIAKPDRDKLFATSLGHMMSTKNPYSISIFNEIKQIDLTNPISSYIPNITNKGLWFINNDKTDVNKVDYNNLIDSFTTYNSSFKPDVDFSDFSKATKLTTLASNSVKSLEPILDDSNISVPSFENILSIL